MVLDSFVADRTGFEYRIESDDRIFLRSGVWRGIPWTHTIAKVRPAITRFSNHALIYVTGGDPNQLDLEEATRIANRAGMPVLMLFQIPNQPLFDRMEDDLIAHTFEQFLETGESDWPLLLPMVRAVIRTIDVAQTLGFDRVVVAGASKRGWSSWLAGCTGDTRIVGIAPMVFDNLDFPLQMQHQLDSWNRYSEQIEDYSRRDLQESASSERGRELTSIVDPIHYLSRIKAAILVINGANDPYWTADALSLYWDRLPKSSRCMIVPNAGHLLGDKIAMEETLAAFCHRTALSQLLPSVVGNFTRSASEVVGHLSSSVTPSSSRTWVATSASLDFRESCWSEITRVDPSHYVAIFGECRFSEGDSGYNLSTPVQILSP